MSDFVRLLYGTRMQVKDGCLPGKETEHVATIVEPFDSTDVQSSILAEWIWRGDCLWNNGLIDVQIAQLAFPITSFVSDFTWCTNDLIIRCSKFLWIWSERSKSLSMPSSLQCFPKCSSYMKILSSRLHLIFREIHNHLHAYN